MKEGGTMNRIEFWLLTAVAATARWSGAAANEPRKHDRVLPVAVGSRQASTGATDTEETTSTSPDYPATLTSPWGHRRPNLASMPPSSAGRGGPHPK
jgi:hypothetical protein